MFLPPFLHLQLTPNPFSFLRPGLRSIRLPTHSRPLFPWSPFSPSVEVWNLIGLDVKGSFNEAFQPAMKAKMASAEKLTTVDDYCESDLCHPELHGSAAPV